MSKPKQTPMWYVGGFREPERCKALMAVEKLIEPEES